MRAHLLVGGGEGVPHDSEFPQRNLTRIGLCIFPTWRLATARPSSGRAIKRQSHNAIIDAIRSVSAPNAGST